MVHPIAIKPPPSTHTLSAVIFTKKPPGTAYSITFRMDTAVMYPWQKEGTLSTVHDTPHTYSS
jgi:hypothetical protein